jgi:D-tyrosyl-tRNA(Tyr) deacylase
MIAVIQRVLESSVEVGSEVVGKIDQGLLVLLGIDDLDAEADADWLAQKIINLRIFSDEEGKMNRAVNEINGNVLVISQFTLIADYAKGNRPSFIRAARPEKAIPLYEAMIKQLSALLNKEIQCGIFGADMKISLVNDGPVTVMLDSNDFLKS